MSARLKGRLTVRAETWPIAGAFRIARGAKTEAHLLVAEIEAGGQVGRGEATPYPRYGESLEDTVQVQVNTYRVAYNYWQRWQR